nr:MAG TPA: hypothetical protein [Caudoviricetes sp.]
MLFYYLNYSSYHSFYGFIIRYCRKKINIFLKKYEKIGKTT